MAEHHFQDHPGRTVGHVEGDGRVRVDAVGDAIIAVAANDVDADHRLQVVERIAGRHLLELDGDVGIQENAKQMRFGGAVPIGYPAGRGVFNAFFNSDFDHGFVTYFTDVEVSGKTIPIETTSLLLSNTQSFSWMIPVVLSGIGIGLFVVSRKSENS